MLVEAPDPFYRVDRAYRVRPPDGVIPTSIRSSALGITLEPECNHPVWLGVAPVAAPDSWRIELSSSLASARHEKGASS